MKSWLILDTGKNSLWPHRFLSAVLKPMACPGAGNELKGCFEYLKITLVGVHVISCVIKMKKSQVFSSSPSSFTKVQVWSSVYDLLSNHAGWQIFFERQVVKWESLVFHLPESQNDIDSAKTHTVVATVVKEVSQILGITWHSHTP